MQSTRESKSSLGRPGREGFTEVAPDLGLAEYFTGLFTAFTAHQEGGQLRLRSKELYIQ